MSRTDRASLLVHVPRSEVFRALTDPEALVVWLPPEGMDGRFETFDLRPGGSYRMVLTYDSDGANQGKSSADADISEVRIAELVPNERIVQEVTFDSADPAFSGTMRMEWSLLETPDGTDVQIEARNVPAGITARDHAQGITSSLSNLAGFLEP